MRLIGRSSPIESSTHRHDADVVVQIGNAKTVLKAAQLWGKGQRPPSSAHPAEPEATKPTAPYQSAPNDETTALKALSQMHEALAPRPQDTGGPWSPWSPDDLYPYDSQPTLSHDHRPTLQPEPSDANLPAYYPPSEQQPSHVPQETSVSATRDMPSGMGLPTPSADPYHLDRFSPTPPLLNTSLGSTARRSKTVTSSTRTRTLDLVHLLPQRSPARMPSHSSGSHSPSAMSSRPDLAMSAVPADRMLRKSKTSARSTGGQSGGSGRIRPFDEDVLDQHKTNVRRPPKGIQNWFDAYLDDDDEEDAVDDDDDDNDAPEPVEEPEPQELPADDILPPAYSGPNRNMSRASEKSASGPRTPHDSHHPPQHVVEQALQQAPMSRANSKSTLNSIQSSHRGSIGRRSRSDPRVPPSTVDRESETSITDSDLDDEVETDDDEEYEVDQKLPAIRDSILDARHIVIANASSVDVMRMRRPTQLSDVRSSTSHSTDTRRASESAHSLPVSPNNHQPPPLTSMSADATALRRLNGLSCDSPEDTDTVESGHTRATGESRSSDSSLHDTVNGSPVVPAHVMAVTDEEKMLLDLMRQKRVAMQQMSFTEGYQLAMRTEQQRVSQTSPRGLKPQPSSEKMRASEINMTSRNPTASMQRQLSAMRRERVDESFQMGRFLRMPLSPQPLSSHPPNPRPRSRTFSGEILLPATRYSPTTSKPSAGSGDISEGDTESVRMRVRQFINTNGAPPPLDSGMKTMRRPNAHHNPSSLPPSPVVRENGPAPALPPRSPERDFHARKYSQHTLSTLNHRPSLSSLNDDLRDRSPVSTLGTQTYYPPTHFMRRPEQRDVVILPPSPAAPSHAEFVSRSSSTPHPPRNSAQSPFSRLINTAAKAGPHRLPSSHAPHPTTHRGPLAPATKQPAPRTTSLSHLQTMNTTTRSQASLNSMTSAGEEVLGAWAELGGVHPMMQQHRTT